MIRLVEYLYLAAAIGGSIYLSLNFKDLPTANKVFLAFMILLCAFMFSFRRKQRQNMEALESEEEESDSKAEQADDEPNDDPK